MKILWFDCETTGLNSIKNDILTLSALIEIDGKIVDKINIKTQPFSWNNISKEALEINGLTLDEIKTFDKPIMAKRKLEKFFCKYVDKYKKNKTTEDKLIPAGYNVLFDVRFLEEFWRKCGDKYIGSFLDYHKLDISAIVLYVKYQGLLQFHGYKLTQVAEALNCVFKGEAHTAEADILMTREVGNKLLDVIQVRKDKI